MYACKVSDFDGVRRGLSLKVRGKGMVAESSVSRVKRSEVKLAESCLNVLTRENRLSRASSMNLDSAFWSIYVQLLSTVQQESCDLCSGEFS